MFEKWKSNTHLNNNGKEARLGWQNKRGMDKKSEIPLHCAVLVMVVMVPHRLEVARLALLYWRRLSQFGVRQHVHPFLCGKASQEDTLRYGRETWLRLYPTESAVGNIHRMVLHQAVGVDVIGTCRCIEKTMRSYN